MKILATTYLLFWGLLLNAQATDYFDDIQANFRQSAAHRKAGNWQAALPPMLQAATIAHQNNDNKRLVQCLNELGNIYNYLGQYHLAIQVLDSSHQLLQISPNSKYYLTATIKLAEAHAALSHKAATKANLAELFKITKANQDSLKLAHGYTVAGVLYTNLNQFDSSAMYYDSAITLYQALGNASQLANTQHNLGIVLSKQSNYQQALTAYLNALRYFEQHQIESQAANVYNSIATLFEKQKDSTSAINYLKAGLQKAKPGSKLEGLLNYSLGNTLLGQAQYDSAIVHYYNALNTWKALNDTVRIVNTYLSLAQATLKTAPASATAPTNLIDSVAPYVIGITDSTLLAEYQTTLGEHLLAKQKPAQALKVLIAAAATFQDRGLPERLFRVWWLQRSAYRQLNDFENYSRLTSLHDSINILFNNQQKQASLQELAVKYETEKREQQIEFLETVQQETETRLLFQNRFLWTISALAVTLFVLAAFIYRSRTKLAKKNIAIQKLNEEQKELNEELHAANDQLELRANELIKMNRTIEELNSELNHRTLNHLELIQSYYELGTYQAEKPELREAMKHGMLKLETMVELYQMLHTQIAENPNLSLQQYMGKLLQKLLQLAALPPEVLTVNGHDLVLPNKTMLYMGIIVTELVTNSIKYGHQQGQQLNINIHWGTENKGEFALTVQDNGPGLEQPPESLKDNSFGLKMVYLLTQQLNGTLQYHYRQGANWQLQLANTFALQTS